MILPGENSPAAPPRYTFRKAERLCSRRLLGELFKQGTAFNAYPLRFVVWRAGAGTAVSGEGKSMLAPLAVGTEVGAISNEQRAAKKLQLATQNSKLQVVLSVSKRHFKRAHDRNYIKRLLREAWRHHQPALLARLSAEPAEPAEPAQPEAAPARPAGALLVAVLYIGKENPESLVSLSRRLRKGLDRLVAELPAAPPASPA